MRPTLHLLGGSRYKTVSDVLNHHALSRPSFPWLSTLKTKELQHLAQRTGLPSSGTKAVLIEGLERGLTLYREQHGDKLFQSNSNEGLENNDLAKAHGDGNEDVDGKDKELRILSIDVGIRNLAFAVLIVRGFGDGLGSRSTLGLLTETLERPNQGRRKGKGVRGSVSEGKNEGEGAVQVSLEAWQRVSLPLDRGLSVEEFGRYLDPPYFAFPSTTTTLTSAPLPESEFVFGCLGTDKGASMAASPTAKGERRDKTPFSLPIYATHAHSIISALLARYKPTHVLIERQRFRSGGGSAVQEWSLRVGVFEGMLWATLHSLRMYRNKDKTGAEQNGTTPRVISIEPARIGRFWAPSTASSPSSDVTSPAAAASDNGEGKKKKKTTSSSREGKKLKINLVGSWLEQDLFLTSHGRTVQPWVDAYMAKWKKMPKPKRGSKSKTKEKTKSSDSDLDCCVAADAGIVETGIDIAKLDDMADCLVQAVTWLEWEGMKGRVVREGIGGVVEGVDVPA
ncbi:mitochondrial resolvase Ydc2 [Aspergillus navahoensis]